MVPINLTIVVARPGARGDFLAGWLGMLPGFVDNQWRIDIPTGRSFGLMSCFKEIDSIDYGNNTLNQLLGYRNYRLGTSPWTFAISCHGYNLADKIIVSENVNIIQITTDVCNKAVIDWEYIAKTYFCQERYESSIQQNMFYNVDKNNVDIKKCAIETRKTVDLELGVPCVQVAYKELFQPGGSYYLCDRLGVQVNEEYHQYWDTQLNFAKSKLSYDIFGKIWTINNYWK